MKVIWSTDNLAICDEPCCFEHHLSTFIYFQYLSMLASEASSILTTLDEFQINLNLKNFKTKVRNVRTCTLTNDGELQAIWGLIVQQVFFDIPTCLATVTNLSCALRVPCICCYSRLRFFSIKVALWVRKSSTASDSGSSPHREHMT